MGPHLSYLSITASSLPTSVVVFCSGFGSNGYFLHNILLASPFVLLHRGDPARRGNTI